MRIWSPGRKTSYVLQWIYGLLSNITTLFPAKSSKPVVIFGAFHGDDFRGNTSVIFKHLSKDPRIHAVWLSRNPDVIQQLKKEFGHNHALLLHSFKALQILACANMVLYTHGTSDFPFVKLPKKAIQVHTYHGLPTKRGEYLKVSGDNREPGILHKCILKHRFGGINYFFSSSPFVSEIFARRFNLTKDQLIETGYPTMDVLIESTSQTGKSYPSTSFLFLYAPTYRRRAKTRWFPFDDMDWSDFDNFLKKHSITLALRAHPNEKLSVSSFQKYSERIVDGCQQPLNALLLQSDAIITDYSGIYLEGLLLDIPPIFIPYDIDKYERGLPYNYDEVTPGPKVGTYAAFKKAIEDVITSRSASHQLHRTSVKQLFFSDTRGMSTQKAILFIEEKLGLTTIL